MDASNGFWQVQLEEKSTYLTTFNTPFGRYKFQRLPFGICSASEEYQQRMMQAVEGLKGIVVVADDILVLGQGETDEEAEKDHDQNLEELLKRCRETNLKINKNKVKFKQTSLIYMGHRITP